MWWLIFLYILPGIITTILLPRFIEYQGGNSFLKNLFSDYEDDYYGYILGLVSFCPVINILISLKMLLWYVLETFK